MAVRSTMTTLIAFVRGLTNDATVPYTLTDQQLQDYLDLNRLDVYNMELQFPDMISVGGVVEWHDFYSQGYNYWEDGYLIQGPDWQVRTPNTSEPLIGRWTFIASQDTPLYITGRSYDVYAAAVNALKQMESTLQCGIDFTADGLTVSRLQRIQNIRELRKTYTAQMRPRIVKMVRSDMRGNYG